MKCCYCISAGHDRRRKKIVEEMDAGMKRDKCHGL